MPKGMLASALTLSLLTAAGCSSDNDASNTAEATKKAVTAVSEKASAIGQEAASATQSAVNDVTATAAAAAGAVTGKITASANKARSPLAMATGTAAVAAVEPLKDDNGNIIITQAFIDSKMDDSRQAAQALGKALKASLVSAIEEGGPTQALTMCNLEAPEIAQKIASDKGVKVSRVSLKNRSLMGEASDWQRSVLNDFEQRKAAGEPISELEFSEVVEYNGQSLMRFMKAIPANNDACMACHGSNIAPEVQAKLDELYPNDKATGYEIGDLRGAFVVLQPM